MVKQFGITAGVLGVILLVSGCMNQAGPVETSTGLNGLQQRALTARNIGEDLDATYNDVWYSVIATLQMNGFILKQADKNSGFIFTNESNPVFFPRENQTIAATNSTIEFNERRLADIFIGAKHRNQFVGDHNGIGQRATAAIGQNHISARRVNL